jgi:hypothetical protein
MKNFGFKLLALSLALVLLGSLDGYAGGRNRAGTNAASELLIPVGARYIAMGGASVATAAGIDAIHWNPAGLSRMTNSAGAMFSHMTYIADIDVEYLAVAANFSGFGTLGVTFKSLALGDIAITTEDSPDGTGGVYSPNFFTFGLTYSRLLTDRISVGATMNLVSEKLDRVSGSAVAFNAGVQYTDLGNVPGLSIGVAMKNVGTTMKYSGTGLLRQGQLQDISRGPSFYDVVAGTDELPSTIELGIGYSRSFGESGKLNLSSLFQNNNYDDDEVKVGAEYAYKDIVFLRGGWQFAPDSPNDATGAENAYVFGPSFGGGFHYDLGGVDFTLDYAWRDVNFFDANNIFTIRLGF